MRIKKLILLLFLATSCGAPSNEDANEIVCLRVHMINGEVYNTQVRIPKRRYKLAIEVHNNRGYGATYYLVCKGSWQDLIVKPAVIDFEYINCQ